MHDTTRRQWCRTAFLLLCLAPTLGAVLWLGICRSATYRAAQRTAWEGRLSEHLGLAVTVEAVAFPERGVTLLQGLELADPETAAHVARIRLVELADTERGLVLLVSQPEIDNRQLGPLWQVLHQRLLRDWPASGRAVQLIAGEVTLHAPDRAQTLTDVRLRLDSDAAGPQASIEFRVAGYGMSDAARFRVVRNRQLSPPATGWEFHTGTTPLPCSLLGEHLPALQGLGQRSQFQGSLWATHSRKGWQGDVTGRFTDVDLDRLVTERFPHKLGGTAELVLSRARFQRGRLVEAAGSLVGQQGVVSRSLLMSAAHALHLEPATRVRDSDQPLWTYEELAFGFELTADGLTIRGHSQAGPPGTMMAGPAGMLLVDPREQLVPAVALIRALVPQSEVLVPATKETDALLHALPLPPIVAPQQQAEVPYSPLRLQQR